MNVTRATTIAAVAPVKAAAAHTPGPWTYVPSNEHHGAYVTSAFGNTIADLYVMSEPGALSTLNGGPSRPIPFLAEMADPNARLIAAAPELLEVLAEYLVLGTGKCTISKAHADKALAAIKRARSPNP